MKYLKLFNESLSDMELSELQDFCETSLAYLIDEGYKLRFENELGYTFININLSSSIFFKWDSIKDSFIPFLQLLSRRYKLHSFSYHQASDDLLVKLYVIHKRFGTVYNYYTLEQIIDDEVLKYEISHVVLKVKGKL